MVDSILFPILGSLIATSLPFCLNYFYLVDELKEESPIYLIGYYLVYLGAMMLLQSLMGILLPFTDLSTMWENSLWWTFPIGLTGVTLAILGTLISRKYKRVISH